jgi:DNA adenine methylase
MQTSFDLGTSLEVSTKPARPFLKWAGGKGQLLEQLVSLLPPDLASGALKTYVEPFIGGGALYFTVAQRFPRIEQFVISDVNEELILAYRTLKEDAKPVIRILEAMEQEYHKLDRKQQKEYFYRLRQEFNRTLTQVDFDHFQADWFERTAAIVFLNRTCFNGLFRVNSRGEFNVPFGDYKNPKICDAFNLQAVSSLLQRTTILRGDFMSSANYVDAQAFVYFDPPYRPISATASFTSYSRYSFDDEAQQRLATYFNALSERGAKLMLSNSDPKNQNPDDEFFDKLYQGHSIRRIYAARMINCDATKRGKVTELVVTNY